MRKVVFLFLFVLGVALGGCGREDRFYPTSSSSLPQPQPSPTPETLPNGWYRYTDHAAGYAISYPSDVRFTISRDKPLEFPQVGLILPPSTGRGNQGITVIVYRNAEALPRQQFLIQKIHNRLYRGKKQLESLPMMETRIGENIAYQVDLGPYLPALYIFHRDKVYFLALHADMLSGMPPTPGARKLFFKIAATFTLLNDEKR